MSEPILCIHCNRPIIELFGAWRHFEKDGNLPTCCDIGGVVAEPPKPPPQAKCEYCEMTFDEHFGGICATPEGKWFKPKIYRQTSIPGFFSEPTIRPRVQKTDKEVK